MRKANKTNYWLYNPALRKEAHEERYSMSQAEVYLWKYCLRAGSMKGYGFRRKRPIMDWVVDFMCKELMLVIEIDIESKNQFAEKCKRLQEAGFTLMHLTSDKILFRINDVRAELEQCILSFEKINGVKARKPRSS